MSGERELRRLRAQRWFVEPELIAVSMTVDERLSGFSRVIGAAMVLDRFQAIHGRLPQHVLDAGCGRGHMLKVFRSYGVPYCEGFDPAESAVKHANSLAHGRCWVGYAQDPVTYSYLSSPPEVIITHLTLGLWSEPQQGLSLLIDALATPGLIYLTDVARDCRALASCGKTRQEQNYLHDQLAASLTLTEVKELLTRVAGSYQWEAGSGVVGGFDWDEPRGRELLQGQRTSRVLREHFNPGDTPPPAGAFLSAWMMKGGESHVDSSSR